MAASANQEGAGGQNVSSANANGIPVNSANNGGNNDAANIKRSNSASGTAQALRHDPGLNQDWTPEEQATLDDLLAKYASDSSIVRKYAKIAMKLNDKTVRDIALRCCWMTKKENGKRRKDDHSSRKSKDRKEKTTDSSAKSSAHLTPRPNGPAYHQHMIPVDNDDGISFEAIGGVTGDLLKQNSQYLNQVSANFSTYQFHDNINLLIKARDNILTILNDVCSLNDIPEIMKQMPPLPVRLNSDLANSILPITSHQTKL